MRQVTRLLVENFQSHERSELRFGSGLNVIVGPSDNGKSALLRALRWALYNEPRGNEFVRAGARECRVTVTLSDGVTIVRELLLTRSGAAGRNRYLLTLPEQETRVFEGFGTEVPAEVVRAHGMPQVVLDADKRVVLSVATQLEGPFMMTETGSTRARAIGRLLGVHVVDAATRSTQRDLRSVRTEVSRFEKDRERYDAELQPYADIPGQEARLQRAEAALDQAEVLGRRLERLRALQAELIRYGREEVLAGGVLARLTAVEPADLAVVRAEALQRRVGELLAAKERWVMLAVEEHVIRTRIDVLSAVPRAESRIQAAGDRHERLRRLMELSDDLGRRTAELSLAESGLQRLAHSARAAELIQQAEERRERLELLQARQADLHDSEKRISEGQQLLRQKESELAGCLGEYEQVLMRLGRCPTCMQPVEPGAVKGIIAELAGGPASGHQH